jgi:putative CocE/NonD family hydrolase
MKYLSLAVGVLSISVVLSGIGAVDAAPAATLPSEIPEKFVPTDYGLDFDKRTVMIPMRDGVRLNTIILVPKGAHNAPILLTRTPYDADDMTSLTPSAHLRSVITGYDHATDVIVDGGYIRVVQDIRGKYGSEGDYVMNRPMRGPQNPTTVDHATDTFDTIDWLVKNIPETNGKVGILGISYDGYLALTALVDPHPALKVAVPMNPTGSTTARFVSRGCPTSTSRRRRDPTTNSGGRLTSTTTTCTWRRVPRVSWADSGGWSRLVSGASC